MFQVDPNNEALDLTVPLKTLKKSDWNQIAKSQNPALSEAFIENYLDKLKLGLILKYQRRTISEAFLRKHASLYKPINWYAISRYQPLSEGFIRDFHDKLHWDLLSGHQILNENLIEEWRYKVLWSKIRSKQKN